jgi:hypothetical protein
MQRFPLRFSLLLTSFTLFAHRIFVELLIKREKNSSLHFDPSGQLEKKRGGGQARAQTSMPVCADRFTETVLDIRGNRKLEPDNKGIGR